MGFELLRSPRDLKESSPFNSGYRLMIKSWLFLYLFWLKLGSKDPGKCMQLAQKVSVLEAIFNGFPRGPKGPPYYGFLYGPAHSDFKWSWILKGLLWGPMRCAPYIPF